MGRTKDMPKQKIAQHKETKEDNISDRIYAKAYNNFAILVEKSYSPRFVGIIKSETLNIVTPEEESSKYEKEPQEEQANREAENLS